MKINGRRLTHKEYMRCKLEILRWWNDPSYFKERYQGQIHPRWLDEDKIFTYHDLYYIKQTNESMR